MLPCAVATAVLTALGALGGATAGAAADRGTDRGAYHVTVTAAHPAPGAASRPVTGAASYAVPGAASSPVTGRGPNSFRLATAARFSPPGAFVPSLALTYDTQLVPAGARVEVEEHSVRGRTTVRLRVSGVRPGHAFGAHVHGKPCGADPAAAGGHYQNRVDPVQPSTDPRYVNAQNEVWLDFTSDARGRGTARATHTWGFRDGEARSVVIHDEPGTKGARVACFTVPFGAVSRS
jgi:Cu-Zn family superoxide dismutase